MLAVILKPTTIKNKASQSYLNVSIEFEAIDRILLYFKVSNNLVNEDFLKSVDKLKFFNNSLEIPYDLNSTVEKEFLEINYYENTLSTMMDVRTIDNIENYFKEIFS